MQDQQHVSAGYKQMISERVSADNSNTWGPETIAAGVADGYLERTRQFRV